MMRFGFLVLAGLAISFGCELGFVLSARTGSEDKYLYLLGYGVATLGLFFFAAHLMSLWSLVGLGLAVALLSVLADQLLGFCCFPGLVKDVEPFHWYHLQILSQMVPIAVGWYLVVVCAAHVAAKMMNYRVG